MSLWLPRGSGLVEQFIPPELSLEAAVERSWRRREGGRLLEPKPDEGPWLQTYPGLVVGRAVHARLSVRGLAAVRVARRPPLKGGLERARRASLPRGAAGPFYGARRRAVVSRKGARECDRYPR